MQIACHICGATYYPPPARRGRGPRRQVRWLARHLAHAHIIAVGGDYFTTATTKETMPRTTDQHTLAAYATRTEARKAAIARIEALMLPGARALAGTRTPTSKYWIERGRDLSASAPFAPAQVTLLWHDQGTNVYSSSAPWDDESPTYSARVTVPADMGPEVLAELARLAQIYTAEIVRECESITAQQVHALDVESRLYQEILA